MLLIINEYLSKSQKLVHYLSYQAVERKPTTYRNFCIFTF